MSRIDIRHDTHVMVLTGAGVSAESGVPTFRDANGLWENHRVEVVASPEGFAANPARVWRFYSQRRAGAAQFGPNAGHYALAALERRLGDRFLLATQNVDGFHRRAGNQRLVEMHGNLFESRCQACGAGPFDDETVYPEGTVPECAACGARALRPNIVWFGEALDPANLGRIEAFLRRAAQGHFVFVAAGTSGVVYPAAGLAARARVVGAETWLVNLEAPENLGFFEHFVQGRSGQLLPALFSPADG